jgi:hypothetical protein
MGKKKPYWVACQHQRSPPLSSFGRAAEQNIGEPHLVTRGCNIHCHPGILDFKRNIVDLLVERRRLWHN